MPTFCCGKDTIGEPTSIRVRLIDGVGERLAERVCVPNTGGDVAKRETTTGDMTTGAATDVVLTTLGHVNTMGVTGGESEGDVAETWGSAGWVCLVACRSMTSSTRSSEMTNGACLSFCSSFLRMLASSSLSCASMVSAASRFPFSACNLISISRCNDSSAVSRSCVTDCRVDWYRPRSFGADCSTFVLGAGLARSTDPVVAKARPIDALEARALRRDASSTGELFVCICCMASSNVARNSACSVVDTASMCITRRLDSSASPFNSPQRSPSSRRNVAESEFNCATLLPAVAASARKTASSSARNLASSWSSLSFSAPTPAETASARAASSAASAAANFSPSSF
mmetsp:Transcript_8002/g.19879  ORF Transcript_8002/g.19879 Transcript_8002/m.19879 type:complete len:344 (+) Transcript_8002:249-1280(+)